MRVTCERCLRRYDLPDATVKGRKLRARCKCGARVVVQDADRAASGPASSHTTGAIQRPVRWFVDITSWEPIAMDLRQLIKAFDAGRIDADTLVWRKGMPDWSRLRDVSELAERLISTELSGTEALPKLPSLPPPAAGDGGGEGMPQVERSRTPPANYAVADQVPGEADTEVQARAASSSDSERSAFGSSERAGVPAEPARSAAPVRQRSFVAPSPAADPGAPRTITHVGLEPPAVVLARNSSPPPAPESAPNQRAPRESRSSGSLSAVAPRRPPSNDETPAQKPSSISLPPPAATSAEPGQGRSRNFLALAAIVLGAGALWLTFGGERPAARTPLAEAAPATRPTAAARPAAPQPAVPPAAAEVNAAASAKAPTSQGEPASDVPLPSSDGQSDQPAPSAPIASPSPGSQPVPKAVGSAPAAREPRPALPPPPRRPAIPPARPAPSISASEPTPVMPRQEATPPAAATAAKVSPPANSAEQPSSPQPSSPQSPSPPSAAPSPAAEPVSTAPAPAAPVPAAPAPTPPPAEFDALGAEEQMGSAARQASRCGQAGPTRGSGRVSVVIEPWGRVGRVTHLEQAFVGTPVGICVMQAFQQVRIPPFEGGPRSLTGFFVVD